MIHRGTGIDRKPLHVLMTADAVGGVWTYALDLVEGLSLVGVTTTLVVAGPSPSTEQRRHVERTGASLVEIDAPLDWTASDIADLRRTADGTAEVADRLRPDVVHLNSPALAALTAFEAPVVGVCHSCLATWWSAVKGGALPLDVAWRTRLVADGYAACAALVAPSRSFAEATAQAYGIEPPAVIHNGRRSPVAAEESPEPLVLTAGRLWDEGKDVRTLDRAAARLDVPFVALGSTQAPDGSAVRLDALVTPGAVSLADVASWMGKAQVFASAALYEPFGLAVFEAAQTGTALVLSDIATFRELWDGAAVFVPPGDAEGFADAILSLLASPEQRHAASIAARDRAERFDVPSMTHGYRALYEQVTRASCSASGRAGAVA